jgi:tripartite-type tricarboxylate transporter receptor subunit TctC
MFGSRLTIATIAFSLVVASEPARAQTAEQFYPGRQMVLIVGGTAGSGYDIIGRMVARYMGNHLPGRPSFIVRNMPGAGGVVAANHMNALADKDGATIAVVGREAIFDALFSGAQSKFKIISGYPGSLEALIALERGEVEARVVSGFAGPEANAVNAWVGHGKARLLLQIGVNKHPDYPTVPHIMDLAKSEEDRQLMELVFVGQAVGRPFFGPPGVPADRGRALQEAFARTMDDPGFKAEAEKQKIELMPLLADEMSRIVNQVYNTPHPLLERAIRISSAAQR